MTGWMWFWSIMVVVSLLLTGGVSLITSFGGFFEIREMFRTKSFNGENETL